MFGSRALGAQRPPTLTQFLDQNATSVSATSGQGNPFQQAVTFRGFAASPLLGTPQGMSVFQDGVRVNEAFGDVVNWDLLPPLAISSIQLIPGSMPAFGLNMLYASSQYALGDENNQDGNGPLPSYTVFNLDARYVVTPALRVIVNVANLFNRTYQTVGLVGANFFTGPNNMFGPARGIPPASEEFRAPAAPLGVWVGIRYAFDRPPRTSNLQACPRSRLMRCGVHQIATPHGKSPTGISATFA